MAEQNPNVIPVDIQVNNEEVNPAAVEITLEDLKRSFNENKSIILAAMQAEMKQAYRVDHVATVMTEAREFFKSQDRATASELPIARKAIAKVVDELNKAKVKVEKLTFESFTSQSYKDILTDQIYYVTKETTSPDVFEYLKVFTSLRPYGERLESVRFTLMDQLKEIQE